MSKSKTKQHPNTESGGSRAVDVVLSLVLIAGIGYGGYYVVSHIEKIDQTTTYTSTIEQTTETEEPTDDKTIYQNEEHANADIYEGCLMLVNSDAEYVGKEQDLVSVYDIKNEADSHSFSVRDTEVQTRTVVAEQLVKMFDDFYETTYDDNIVVLSGYRTRESQQELYDEDLAATGLDYSELVALPGHSEHETGWCVDLSLYDGTDYDGTGIYSWIEEHCYEYGFILRYPENKVDITKIKYEPWHFRYVGSPHASYMMNEDLCLEEYMDLLEQYPYEGEHLVINDYDGKLYEVYFVAEDTAFESTMVPVPGSLPYTVLGNNRSGFIVTVDTGETGEPVQRETEAGSETSDEEDTDGEEDTEA